MKNILNSFVISTALTTVSIASVTSDYGNYLKELNSYIDTRENIKNNKYFISENIEKMQKSDEEFYNKVIPFLHKNFKIIDTNSMGHQLGLIAKAIDTKISSYNNVIKIFKKDKKLQECNKQVLELREKNILIKKEIQTLIDLVFLNIEAKAIYILAEDILKEKDFNFTLNDFWYTHDLEDDNKALFVNIKGDINLDDIYEFEDDTDKAILKMQKEKQQTLSEIKLNTQQYDFNAISKSFFKRLSVV